MEEVGLETLQAEATVVLDCPLAIATPLPLTHHPAAVYLSQLAPRSRRTMRQALNSLASLFTQGQCDAFTLDWAKLRYPHTAALRSILMEKYSPATANRMLCALRRTLKEAQRLKLMPLEDYADAVDLPNIRGGKTPQRASIGHRRNYGFICSVFSRSNSCRIERFGDAWGVNGGVTAGGSCRINGSCSLLVMNQDGMVKLNSEFGKNQMTRI